MNKIASLSAAALAVSLCACDGSVPQVRGNHEAVVPSVAPPYSLAMEAGPPSNDPTSASEEQSTECAEWVTARDEWNQATGEFDYLYTCATGGDIASVERQGKDDLSGNGTYVDLYTFRNGDTLTWSYTYTSSSDYMSQVIDGVSEDGQIFHGEYTYLENGDSRAHEVSTLAEGIYVTDGIYSTDGRFNGTYTFDDPSTPASPDWTVVEIENADGSIEQRITSETNGWLETATYKVAAGGVATYDFIWEDPSTAVSPDYAGAYVYNVDGSAFGDYTQPFDDGSLLKVHQTFRTDAVAFVESWMFDDAATPQPIDQEGAISYDNDLNGVGTMTTFGANGFVQTCDVKVSSDGTTTIDNCL
jgi:hypothetical protein